MGDEQAGPVECAWDRFVDEFAPNVTPQVRDILRAGYFAGFGDGFNIKKYNATKAEKLGLLQAVTDDLRREADAREAQARGQTNG